MLESQSMMLLANVGAVNKNQLELRDFLLRIIEAAQIQNADKLKALGKELENAKASYIQGQPEIIGLTEANFQGELDKVKLGEHVDLGITGRGTPAQNTGRWDITK